MTNDPSNRFGHVVNLTPDEAVHGQRLGADRRLASASAGLIPGHGCPRDPALLLKIDMLGAIGECLCAKYLGLPMPTTINTFKRQADLLDCLEVRSVEQAHHGLIVRHDDRLASAFVLVLVTSSSSGRIRGFLRGYDAIQPRYRRSPNGRDAAYFVPAVDLHPPHRLRHWIEDRCVAPDEDEIRWAAWAR